MEGMSSNPLPGAIDPLALVNSTWALEAFLDVSFDPPPLPPSASSYGLGICSNPLRGL